MKRIAIIEFGVVVNLAVWDGASEWNPGDRFTVVDVSDLPTVSKGWAYDGHTFTAPSEDPA